MCSLCLRFFNCVGAYKGAFKGKEIETVKRLKFSKEGCIGCQLCAQVCSGMREGEYIPSKARISIESYYVRGGELRYKDSYCTLCGICAKKCPTGAIAMTDKITVNFEACTGCGVCVEACPKKVIKLIEEKPLICDTCDGDPSCVKICPHGALRFE